MLSIVTRCKLADDNTKDVVFGYTKDIEKKLLSLNMPLLIKYLCLNYYFIDESFGIHGENIVVNEAHDTAKYNVKHGSTNVFGMTVYGNSIIDVNDTSINEYLWRFNILSQSDDPCGFYIGIDSSNKKHINTDFSWIATNSSPYYAFSATGPLYLNKSLNGNASLPINTHTASTWKADDIIKMTLNVKTQKLKLFVNESLERQINDIELNDTRYNLAIVLSRIGQKIQLMQFKCN